MYSNAIPTGDPGTNRFTSNLHFLYLLLQAITPA